MKNLLSFTAFARAFMSDICETVLVKGDNGPVRVNKSDFDADQAKGGAKLFTLHKETKAEEDAGLTAPQPTGATATPVDPALTIPPAPSAPDLGGAAVPPANPAPNQYLAMKDGKKFFVVNAAGERAEIDGINNKDGYATEQDAWNAILTIPR